MVNYQVKSILTLTVNLCCTDNGQTIISLWASFSSISAFGLAVTLTSDLETFLSSAYSND